VSARDSHYAPARHGRQRRARFAGRAIVLVVLGALALTAAPSVIARACGQCVEDKVAATFDAGVRERATRIGHVVVFTEVRGPAAGAPPALRDFIARTLAATAGVDPGTVRVSLEPPAAAFACDPARHAPAALIAAINPRLESRRLSLVFIKVDGGRKLGATRGAVSANVPRARTDAEPRPHATPAPYPVFSPLGVMFAVAGVALWTLHVAGALPRTLRIGKPPWDG